jgi:hypothetical protein
MDPKDPIKPVMMKRCRVARVLGVCDRTVGRYIDKELLEARNVGGLQLVVVASLEKLLGREISF